MISEADDICVSIYRCIAPSIKETKSPIRKLTRLITINKKKSRTTLDSNKKFKTNPRFY